MTRLLLLLSLIVTGQALEVVGEPAYLTTTTPSWRQIRLGEVLTDIGKLAGCPITRDETLADAEQGQQVTLILTGPQPLRQVLTLLEETQDLHITAGVASLTVMPVDHWRMVSRREIRIDLRDYGALIAFPDPEPSDVDRRVPRSLDPNASVLPPIQPLYRPDAEAVIEYMSSVLSHVGENRPKLRLEDDRILVAVVNPDEEARLRRELDRLGHAFTQTTTWTTTFGVLPVGQMLPVGVIPHADADALRKRLTTVKQLHLQAHEQRTARVADQRRQELVTTLERLPNELLPIAEVLTTGWSCELRPIRGWKCDRLTYQLSWSEARPLTTVSIVVPPAPAADPSANTPGQTLTLAKPAVWSWEPAGDVFLPPNHALVLVAPHTDGRAIIVLERAP